ncbi:ATP-binding cassette domain-containing protein [Methylopila musalis]|uniref:ATP-binding cassette domain-containing protein n=1 Tax=Methylopila musalis TaxID=1134781 RepID=A0ABW3ZAK5_9HYPH
MLEFISVSKTYGKGRKRREVLSGVTLALPPGRKIGLLGATGAGKSTVIRLLSALEPPDEGVVRVSGLRCWPMSYAGFLDRGATLIQNARMFEHMFGVSSREVAEIAEQLSGVKVGKFKLLKSYNKYERRFLTLGLTLSMQFDWYFVDDGIPPPPPSTGALMDETIQARFNEAGVVWATRDPAFLSGYCDAGLVLHRGALTFYDTFDAASEAYLKLNRNEGTKRK